MFHTSVADRLGLNVTDHKCLDFLLLYGPSTAGELAQRTALTTGAITTVLDRLERAGFVRREADPNDRRRVMVHPVYQQFGKIGSLFADLSIRMNELASRYTDNELALIIEFMNRTCDVLHEAALHLRREAAGTSSPKERRKSTSSKASSDAPPRQSASSRSGADATRAVKRRR